MAEHLWYARHYYTRNFMYAVPSNLLRILIDTFPSHIYGWRIYPFLINTQGPETGSLIFIIILYCYTVLNTAGLKIELLMDSWMEWEIIPSCLHVFTYTKIWRGEEAEITVRCLDFPALEICSNPFHSLPMKLINWMSQWLWKKKSEIKIKLHYINMSDYSHPKIERKFVRTVFQTLSRNRKQYDVQTFGNGIWY